MLIRPPKSLATRAINNYNQSLGISFIHLSARRNNATAVPVSYSVVDPVNGTSKDTPLFITHGLLGMKQNWQSVAKAISKVTGRRVVTFDARNHGESPHSPDHSYDAMTEDVVALKNTLNISDKISFMGHSMGGRTAITLAMKYPEIVDKLIVVDISPVSLTSTFHSEMESYLRAMHETNFDLGRSVPLSEGRKIANKALSSLVKDPFVRAFLVTNLSESNGRIHWKPNLPVLLGVVADIGHFPSEILSRQFSGQTLFVRGEKSTYVPPEDYPAIKKIFPSSKIETIKGAGHWPHADNIKDFLQVVNTFLR